MPMSSLLRKFDVNAAGRDFVVGDIHGEFSSLERELEKLEFNTECDRLFSVGDLIDRGPHSIDVLKWLNFTWFHAVQGNHEAMLVKLAFSKTGQLLPWLLYNGGEWWFKIQPNVQREIIDALAVLPLLIEIQTRRGKVGIAHADIPQQLSWEEVITELDAGNEQVREQILWSRVRAKGYAVNRVDGIEKLFCGHTPLPRPVTVGNVHLIDTGACYGGRLTVVPIIDDAPPAPTGFE